MVAGHAFPASNHGGGDGGVDRGGVMWGAHGGPGVGGWAHGLRSLLR